MKIVFSNIVTTRYQNTGTRPWMRSLIFDYHRAISDLPLPNSHLPHFLFPNLIPRPYLDGFVTTSKLMRTQLPTTTLCPRSLKSCLITPEENLSVKLI